MASAATVRVPFDLSEFGTSAAIFLFTCSVMPGVATRFAVPPLVALPPPPPQPAPIAITPAAAIAAAKTLGRIPLILSSISSSS